MVYDTFDWLEEQLKHVPGRLKTAEVIRYVLNHRDGLTRFLDDGRLELDNNTVERGIRPIGVTESFYAPSSSDWKHWDLIFGLEVTRAAFPPHRPDDLFILQVSGADLVGGAWHNLFSGEDASLDEPADPVVGDAELFGDLRHCEPFAILLGGTEGVYSSDTANGTDAVGGPGLALTGGQAHPVKCRGNLFVGPAGRHALHDGQCIVRGSTVMFSGFGLSEPELGVMAADPMNDQDNFPRVVAIACDIGDDVGNKRAQQSLAGAHGHPGLFPSRFKVFREPGEIRPGRSRLSRLSRRKPCLTLLNAA